MLPLSLTTQAPAIGWVRALVDTGCSHTSVTSTLAQSIGLNIAGRGSAHNAQSTTAVNIFHADLILKPIILGNPVEIRVPDCRLMEFLHPSLPFDVLLGMDLLMQGTMYINGTNCLLTFCW